MAKILLLEDEKDMADMLAGFLKRKGFEVDVAYDLEGAVARFDSTYDIVLLDIVLGNNQTSFPFLKKIKTECPETIVLMVTAHDDDEKIRESRRLGADDYILKPFRTDYLEEFLLSKIQSAKKKKDSQA